MQSLDDPPPPVVEVMAQAHFDALPRPAQVIAETYNAIPGVNPLQFYRTTREEAAKWGPDSEGYLTLHRSGPLITYASEVPSPRALVHELLHVKSMLIEQNAVMGVKPNMQQHLPWTLLGMHVDHIHVVHAESEVMGQVHPKWRGYLEPVPMIDAQAIVRWLVAFRLFGDEALASPLGRQLDAAQALNFAQGFYRAAGERGFDHNFILANLRQQVPQPARDALIGGTIDPVTLETQFYTWED